jgi:hypothetical protein
MNDSPFIGVVEAHHPNNFEKPFDCFENVSGGEIDIQVALGSLLRARRST